MSDLTSEIQQIDGIGEKKAAQILEILEKHGVGRNDPLLEKAREAALRGDERRAAIFLRRSERDN